LRLLQSFLFQVSPYDPAVFSFSVALVLLLALGASLVPARRAAFTDPMLTLRSE
jgi:ABC-type lipoprotein release transport system permease subunit